MFIHVLAVYDFHFRSIPFQELRSFLMLTPDTSLHFHSNHTLQHPAASGNTHFHFASSIHSVFPKSFSHAFPMVCFSFLRRVSPIKSPNGRAVSNYTLSVRCSSFANPRIMPRKPLIGFIEDIFRVVMKTIKGFPMGTDATNIFCIPGVFVGPHSHTKMLCARVS